MTSLFYPLAIIFAHSLQAGTVRPGDIAEAIRLRVELTRSVEPAGISGEVIYATAALPMFYELRNFSPAWMDSDGQKASVGKMTQAIIGAWQEGLDPNDYHLQKIFSVQRSLRVAPGNAVSRADKLAELDILLTDAYLLYASHLHTGKVNPETISADWKWEKRNATMPLEGHLEDALKSGMIKESLWALAPRQPEYIRLKSALAELRALQREGGWNSVTPGGKLEEGMTGFRVEELRVRLEAGNYLVRSEEYRDQFDAGLKVALQAFQAGNGLNPDGVAGAGTIEAMNMTIEQRIGQIKVNMERWRWLPADLGMRYIRVNIANFGLEVFEGAELVFRSKAIVGRTYRKTPLMSATLTHIIFNPFWTIPPNILRNDIVQEAKKDSNYLISKRIRVTDQAGNFVDAKAIDWPTYAAGQFTFRQDPGSDNSLGSVKFVFPNRYNVYIHDTPVRNLFEKDQRALSSGCIRIQDPMGFAEYLLYGQGDWDRARIEHTIASDNRPIAVILERPIPVHFLYFTALGQEGHDIQFRKDVYGLDKAVATALDARPPSL